MLATAPPLRADRTPSGPQGPATEPVVPVRQRRVRTSQLWAAAAVNVALVAAMWTHHGGLDQLSGPGGWLIAAGQLAGLYGTLAVLVQLMLMSRSPWLEQLLGRDRLVAGHRWVGIASVWLLSTHAVTITLGYAAGARSVVLAELWRLLTAQPDILMAAVGLVLFLAVGLTSAQIARRRLRYEDWYFVHLYGYLAIALTFAHQLAVGTDFVDDPLARAYWVALFAVTFGCLAAFRVAQPLLALVRHRPVVAAVVPEGPGVVSLYVTGRRMDRLAADPGQFFNLRFLTLDGWWRAHPFSLSAPPDGRSLRFTVKALGDWTTRLQRLTPGTRLLLEGPYGAVTPARQTRDRALLIAGGVGVTPLRAMLGSLPVDPGAVTVLYRAPSWDQVLFRAELDAMAAERGIAVGYLVGRRGTPEMPVDPFRPEHLEAMCPDVVARDVYVCGPPAMTEAVLASLAAIGVPAAQIHSERFAY